jgi:hypothetical protein
MTTSYSSLPHETSHAILPNPISRTPLHQYLQQVLFGRELRNNVERPPEPCPDMSIRVRTLASNPFSNHLRTCTQLLSTQLAQILHPKWTTRKTGWVRALHRSAASPGVWAFSVVLRVAHYFRCRCLDLLVAGQAVGPRRLRPCRRRSRLENT